MYVCMYMYVCMCMYVCMYVCMYMYVCMCIFMCVDIEFLSSYKWEGSDLGLTGELPRNLPKFTTNNHKISVQASSRWPQISTRKLPKQNCAYYPLHIDAMFRVPTQYSPPIRILTQFIDRCNTFEQQCYNVLHLLSFEYLSVEMASSFQHATHCSTLQRACAEN